jgi:hypothetical protein
MTKAQLLNSLAYKQEISDEDGVNYTELIQKIILLKSSYKAELKEKKTERGRLLKEYKELQERMDKYFEDLVKYKDFVMLQRYETEFALWKYSDKPVNKPKLLRRYRTSD